MSRRKPNDGYPAAITPPTIIARFRDAVGSVATSPTDTLHLIRQVAAVVCFGSKADKLYLNADVASPHSAGECWVESQGLLWARGGRSGKHFGRTIRTQCTQSRAAVQQLL